MDGQYEDYPPAGNIDQGVESYQDYNETGYSSLDWINTKNPQESTIIIMPTNRWHENFKER